MLESWSLLAWSWNRSSTLKPGTIGYDETQNAASLLPEHVVFESVICLGIFRGGLDYPAWIYLLNHDL